MFFFEVVGFPFIDCLILLAGIILISIANKLVLFSGPHQAGSNVLMDLQIYLGLSPILQLQLNLLNLFIVHRILWILMVEFQVPHYLRRDPLDSFYQMVNNNASICELILTIQDYLSMLRNLPISYFVPLMEFKAIYLRGRRDMAHLPGNRRYTYWMFLGFEIRGNIDIRTGNLLD